MKRLLQAAGVLLALAAAGGPASGAEEGRRVVGPDYRLHPPANAASCLADARAYFHEGSYAWALAAAEELARRWPDNPERAESDYIRLYCQAHLNHWAAVDVSFDDYFDRHPPSNWAAAVVDLTTVLYSRRGRDLFGLKLDFYDWESYLTLAYPSVEWGEESKKLGRRREKLLKYADRVYGVLIDDAPTPEESRARVDELAFVHIIMTYDFAWDPYGPDDAEQGRARKRLAKLEMSDELRSALAFAEGLTELECYRPPEKAWRESGRPRLDYGDWVTEERLRRANEKWEDVAASYPGAAGGVLAEAAMAHYDVVALDAPARAAARFDRLAEIARGTPAEGFWREKANVLRRPALVISAVKLGPNAADGIEVSLRYRSVPEVELAVYEADAALYLELYRDVCDSRLATEDLAGVRGEAVARWAVATREAEEPGDYRLREVTTSRAGFPYGLYVVEARAGQEWSRAVFCVTDAVATTANDGERAYVHVLDAVSGEAIPFAVASAKLVRLVERPRDRGPSWVKPDLMAGSVEPAAPELAPTGAGATLDLSTYPSQSELFLHLTSSRGPVLLACGVLYGDVPDEELEGVIITDRPLYKPGDTVHYKGILRRVDFAAKELSPAPGVEVTLDPRRGRPAPEGAPDTILTTDEYGTFAGELELSEGTRLGYDYLGFSWEQEELREFPNGRFGVAEFEKPEFEVTVTPRKERHFVGERAELDVRGEYYFGEPIVGGKIRYDIWAIDLRSRLWELVAQGEATLDAEGKETISADLRDFGVAEYELRFYLDVEESLGRGVRSSGEVRVSQTDRLVALRETAPYNYHYLPGEEIEIEVEVTDLDRNGLSADVTWAAYEYDPYRQEGRKRYDVLAVGETTTGASGKGRIAFRLDDPSKQAEVVATTAGSNGRGVSGSCCVDFQRPEDRGARDLVALNVSDEEPRVGDELAVVVTSPVADANCLLFAETDSRPVRVWYVALQPSGEGSRATLSFIVDEDLVPKFELGAIVVNGGKSSGAWKHLNVEMLDRKRLDLEVASDRAVYRPGENVTVTARCTDLAGAPLEGDLSLAVVDEALLALEPDATAEVLDTFDRALHRYIGAVVESSLSSRGEIVKVYPWLPYYAAPQRPPVVDFFPAGGERYGKAGIIASFLNVPYGVRRELEPWLNLAGYNTMWFNARKAGFVKAKSAPGEIYAGWAGGIAGLETGCPPTRPIMGCAASEGDYLPALRHDFADAAYWAPNLRADESGVATASFKLPDNVTKWRAIALAMDRGQRFGYATTTFEATKNVVARLRTPTHFVVGDEARLTAAGHNFLPDPMELRLELKTEGVTATAGDEAAAEKLPAGGDVVLNRYVRAEAAGEASLVVSALTEVESDAAEYRVPVYPRGVQLRQAFAGRLRDEVNLALTVADGADPATFRGELLLAPSLAATLSHGLAFFRDYPYDCVEQTVNRFRVNAELAAAAAELGLEETHLAAGLEGAILAGLVKLEDVYQPSNYSGRDIGGWPWNPGGETSPYITAYVLDAAHSLQGNPFVPAEVSYSLEEVYLNRHDLGRWVSYLNEHADAYADALQLYVVDVALRTGVVTPHGLAVPEIANRCYERRQSTDPMSLALLALVLHQMGDDERLAVVMRNLDNGAQAGPDDTIYWGKAPAETWRWWDDAVETTAKVLEVKLAYQPDDPNIAKMVDWLVGRRRGAAWKSTKDSAAATLALMKYIKANPELAAPIVASYKFGTREGDVELDPTSYEEPAETVTLAWEDVAVGENDVEIHRTSGEGPAFYTAAVEYYVEAEEIPAVQGSVTLERDYYIVKREAKRGRVKERREPLDRPLRPGEFVEVELTINSPYDFDYVVVEDPKPAGLIYVERQSGYRPGSGAYVELWNRQRSAFFEWLPRGETVMRYRLRAEIPGTYMALPARVYGMYSPDIGSSTPSAVIEIGE